MIPASYKVCILSTSHGLKDDRIFHKQAMSLVKAGYQVAMVVQHTRCEEVNGVHVVPLPPVKTRFGRYVAGTVRILFLALGQKARLYHLHDPELVPVGIVLKLLGKRVIYDVHEDYEAVLRYMSIPPGVRFLVVGLWRLCEQLGGRLFDHVIAATSNIRDKFPPEKTSVIANYPPLRFGNVERLPKLDDSLFRVVYVGVTGKRCLDKVIAALDLLPGISLEFHVAGWAEEPNLLRLLQTHSKVVYHGVLPWEKVSGLLAIASLGVVLYQPDPNYTCATGEGFIKLYEYMSVGLPVLVSNFPNLKRLIESIGAGMAVDPADSVAIAEAIRYLHAHPEIRRRMGENGRRAVQERYNWEQEEKRLLNIYARVLTGDNKAYTARAKDCPS